MTRRVLTLAALLLAAWCVMTVTHELGHIVGGWIGGGTLRDFEWRPWRLPHSQFQPDPFPRLTLWAGPIVGVAAPLFAAAMIRQLWAAFLGDFCLLANGVYLALAWITGDALLDTARLLEHGASRLSIAAYCVGTITLGYTRFRKDCQLLLDGAPLRTRTPVISGNGNASTC